MSIPMPAFIKSIFSAFPLSVYPVFHSAREEEEEEETTLLVDGGRDGLAAEILLRRRGVTLTRCVVSTDAGLVLSSRQGETVGLEAIERLERLGKTETTGTSDAVKAVLSTLHSPWRRDEIVCLNALVDDLDEATEARIISMVHLATPAQRQILTLYGKNLIALHDRFEQTYGLP